jgi:Gnt-I system high-affinity gluconate transporter
MTLAIVLRCLAGLIIGLTTTGLLAPVLIQTHTSPNLLVQAVGAGSLLFSHVNDAGFWMFKRIR